MGILTAGRLIRGEIVIIGCAPGSQVITVAEIIIVIYRADTRRRIDLGSQTQSAIDKIVVYYIDVTAGI